MTVLIGMAALQWLLWLLGVGTLLPVIGVAAAVAAAAVWRPEGPTAADRRLRLPGGTLLLAAVLALSLLPFHLAFVTGELSFTYASLGFEPSFTRRLPAYALMFTLGSVLGTETMYRRGFFQRWQTDRLLLLNFGQSALYLMWWLPVLLLGFADAPLRVQLYLGAAEFAGAYCCGLLYLLTKSRLISGIWSSWGGFLPLYVMSDVECSFNSAFYYVAASQRFYSYRLTCMCLLAAALALCWRLTESSSKEPLRENRSKEQPQI